MSFYERHVLPRLLHLAMGQADIMKQREQVIPGARGRVLEVGIGSGLNLGLYGAHVSALTGIDPSEPLLAMAAKAAAGTRFETVLSPASGESLPFPDAGFDCVVTTWTLCSIPDVGRALGEMRRVLKAEGDLLFIEHGLAADAGVQKWKHRLTPLWRRCAGGCHLDRPIPDLIGAAGFRIGALSTGHLIKGPRPLTYHYRGQARLA